MAESWRQKQVDIVHWLQGIQPPSPDPLKDSNRELTSSSDMYTTDNASKSSPINTPISPSLANTQLLSSPPKPLPVHEPLAVVSSQSTFTASPVATSLHDPVVRVSSHESRLIRQKRTQSPLPALTHKHKLPTFSTVDEDDDPHEGNKIDLKRFNKLVNKPPSNPIKPYSRSSTSPVILRKDSTPIVLSRKPRTIPRSSLAETLTVDNLSRKKSLSDQDICQKEEKERKTSRGTGYSSDTELKRSNSEARDSSDLQSSTGACGIGSDMSSSHGSDDKSLAVSRVKHPKGMLLSAQSVGVIENRLRGLKLGTTVEDRCLSPTRLTSPTSPHPSLHSHTPTPPTSPYHMSIIPLAQRPEKLLRMRSTDNERGISMARLKQFNMSQQFSFDTTNDDEFFKPAKSPKFLKSNFLSGRSHSKLGLASHSRSHSDVSAFNIQNDSRLDSFKMDDRNSTNITDRQYKSHLDLSSDQEKPLTLYEQIQLRKSLGNSGNTKKFEHSKKTKVFRQDSGLGTLSTIS